MRQLSSNLTNLNKYWYPAGAITGVGILMLMRLTDPAKNYVTHTGDNPALMPLVIFFPVLFFVFWYGMRLKTVVLDGSELVISGYLSTIRVPLREVEKIGSNPLRSPEIISIRFSEKTPFGKKIIFMPSWRVTFGFSQHPVVKELEAMARVAKGTTH
ncbi:MAG TPA: hypothetical protein VGT99_08510 [Gammaproteobacteria bacterium]|nr:hypothetical protein [Gammaproteobacteria bacterium]